MSNSIPTYDADCPSEVVPAGRISVEEISQRLNVGRVGVYRMLEEGLLPGIRLGRRWIITRPAFELWERTCGMQVRTGLQRQPEVTV
jgi:excisionase family DNA binding protein